MWIEDKAFISSLDNWWFFSIQAFKSDFLKYIFLPLGQEKGSILPCVNLYKYDWLMSIYEQASFTLNMSLPWYEISDGLALLVCNISFSIWLWWRLQTNMRNANSPCWIARAKGQHFDGGNGCQWCWHPHENIDSTG